MKQDAFVPRMGPTFVFDLVSVGISWSVAACNVGDTPPDGLADTVCPRADPLEFIRGLGVCQPGRHRGRAWLAAGSHLDRVRAALCQAGDQSLSWPGFLFLSLPYIQSPLPACLPSFQATENLLKRREGGQEHRQGKESWV